MRRISKIYRILLLLLPVVIYFSYFPVISLGSDNTMNFELSIPLIWLVIFDVVAVVLMVMHKKIVLLVKKWIFMLFPVFASLSIIWSSNALRGILTAGIMWAVYLAVFAIVVLKDEVADEKYQRLLFKIFIVASLAACVWCVVQCVMDVMGISREFTLMCEGCVANKFGFPHPNGFAIEPQFMGNLLLAPAILLGWLMMRGSSEKKALIFIAITATLFLTFSRGAIYAFIVAMIFMVAFMLVSTPKEKRKKMWKRVAVLWTTIFFSFAVVLNVQGVLAEIGPTSDTYYSGVAKALNQLSLGIIDMREEKFVESGDLENDEMNDDAVIEKEDATFDGYVEESTEVRVRMTKYALTLWSSDSRNMTVGVGLGGAGKAMQEAGLIDNANEIVQNQYVSVLLETGIIGAILLMSLLLFIVRLVIKTPSASVLLTLFVAYGVTLCFFAGLPNALQVYLLPALVFIVLDNRSMYDKMVMNKDKNKNGRRIKTRECSSD